MRVYLGDSDPDAGWEHFSNLPSLAKKVLDSEATEIYCKFFLSKYSYEDLPKLVELLVSKIRKGGKIRFFDLDFDMVARQLFREEQPINLINTHVFRDVKGLNSFINLDTVRAMLPPNFKITTMNYGSDTFTLEAERIQ